MCACKLDFVCSVCAMWLQVNFVTHKCLSFAVKVFLKKSVRLDIYSTAKTSLVNIRCAEKLCCDWCLCCALILFCPVPSVSSLFMLNSICFSLLHSPVVCGSFFSSAHPHSFVSCLLFFRYFPPKLLSHSTSFPKLFGLFLPSFLLSLIKPTAMQCVSVCAS